MELDFTTAAAIAPLCMVGSLKLASMLDQAVDHVFFDRKSRFITVMVCSSSLDNRRDSFDIPLRSPLTSRIDGGRTQYRLIHEP